MFTTVDLGLYRNTIHIRIVQCDYFDCACKIIGIIIVRNVTGCQLTSCRPIRQPLLCKFVQNVT